MVEHTNAFGTTDESTESPVRKTLYGQLQEITQRYPTIIRDSGINWSDLYRIPEEAVAEVEALMNEYGHRFSKQATVGLGNMHTSVMIRVYQYFQDPNIIPGVNEKNLILDELVAATEGTTPWIGYSVQLCGDMIKRLREFPDVPDVVGYNIHYHH